MRFLQEDKTNSNHSHVFYLNWSLFGIWSQQFTTLAFTAPKTSPVMHNLLLCRGLALNMQETAYLVSLSLL